MGRRSRQTLRNAPQPIFDSFLNPPLILTSTMKGIIVNYRLSRHVQSNTHLIVQVEGISTREKAQELVGKEVSWKSPADREIKGKVASAHGNSGALRVIFEKGMPGQSIANSVEIK